jgi:hypothetical protein
MVVSVIQTKFFFAWPLGLIAQYQADPLQQIADAVTLYMGAVATILFISTLAPAMIAWWIDVSRFRSMREGTDLKVKVGKHGTSAEPHEGDDDGLNFAPISVVTGLVAVLAPAITSPLADAVKHFVNIGQN